MARIHENTLKWLNEQLKKKHIKNKSNNVVVEEDLKQCIYCHKLFLNATFVVKHIFKRHAEQFLRLHKKFIDTTKTDPDLDPQSVLVSYLKSEFFNLKTELEAVKKAVTHHTHNDQIKNLVSCPIGCQESKSSSDSSNINAFGDKLLTSNPEVIVEKVARDDFMKLQTKVDEVSQMYKEVVLPSKDRAVLQEDRICKRLKNELLTDFESLLIRYQDQNSEWKMHFLQLKNDLRRLEQAVELNTKKIESPEVLKEIENKIEQQIESFYANYGIFDGRSKTPSKSSRKVLNDNSLSVHRSNRRKKSIYTCSSQGVSLQNRQLDTSIKANDPHVPGDLSETYNARMSSILKGDSEYVQKLGVEKAKIIFGEKLKDLSISSKIMLMSNEEYETKMHLVNAQKELLCQKFENFQQVYERLDSQANKLVKSKMERKLRKQLRFSDSIQSQASGSKDKVLGEHTIEKSSPVEQINSGFMQQSEFMHDFGGCGDFSEIKNDYSSEFEGNLASGDYALTASEGFKFQEHFDTLQQNLPQSNEFAELKLIDNRDKSFCPKPPRVKSVDEFSELSSLDSDSNLSQCEFERS